MNCFEKFLGEPYFTWMKNGKKTIEGRPNCGSFSKIKKGDIIVWFNDECGPNARRYLRTKVLSTMFYENYEDMLKKNGIHNIIPYKKVRTIKEGVKILYNNYSRKIIEKYGVLAVRVKIIKR